MMTPFCAIFGYDEIQYFYENSCDVWDNEEEFAPNEDVQVLLFEYFCK